MVNLIKQLMTSRIYWSGHDLLLRFWWVGASLLVCFWISVFIIKQSSSSKLSDKGLFGDLLASEEQNEVIDWDLWLKEKTTYEKSIEKENISEKVNRDTMQKSDIEIGLDNLNKKYPNRKYVFWKSITCKITAYTPDSRSCGASADGFTSKMDNAYRFDGVAASPDVIPYRTGVLIPGVGIKEVDDTGGAMRQAAKKGYYHIDVRIRNHEDAMRFGVRWQTIHLFKIEG